LGTETGLVIKIVADMIPKPGQPRSHDAGGFGVEGAAVDGPQAGAAF
jgi:hypothetical protein